MHHNGRYDVVRDANSYRVIDKQRKNTTVIWTASSKVAHTQCAALNAKHVAERDAS